MPTTLSFHVQPLAKQTEIVGWHSDAIKIRLAAPPVDGKANDELIEFLARRLALPRAALRVVRGERSRRKAAQLSGISEPEALERLGLTGPTNRP